MNNNKLLSNIIDIDSYKIGLIKINVIHKSTNNIVDLFLFSLYDLSILKIYFKQFNYNDITEVYLNDVIKCYLLRIIINNNCENIKEELLDKLKISDIEEYVNC
jgi:hypothetical protein